MISSINEIKSLGIYKDFKKDAILQDFKKYNLFYGWNGSGKSTLSKLFTFLQKGSIPEDYLGCEFKITLVDGSVIDQKLDNTTDLIINVFNQDFINENINWNATVKSILLISEEKIEEHEKLEKLNNERSRLSVDLRKLDQSIESEQKTINTFLSSSAKKIKEHFQVIDTSDKYYFNYNRTKFEKLIEDKKELEKHRSLSPEEVVQITKSVKPEIKEALNKKELTITKDMMISARLKIEQLINTSIVSTSITKLTKNADLSNWIEKGLGLHKNNQSLNCEFCGEPIKSERLTELERHFNNEYVEFKERLIKAQEWIVQNNYELHDLPRHTDFYDEYKEEYLVQQEYIMKLINDINNTLKVWREEIEKKILNPFDLTTCDINLDEETFSNFYKTLERINKIIDKHNTKTANFQKEIQHKKKQLEIHFTIESILNFNFFNKQQKLRSSINNKKEVETKLLIVNSEIQDLEKLLSNEVLGAHIFNQNLHNFLGRKELTLKFDDKAKGYRILRSDKLAKNLSEGEKTAIAFVYFITKLKEGRNNIQNNIVVVDDPISSFDANNLFHAYSYLKLECKEAKQLFVLTHNFVFYKLVRDWFTSRNMRNKSSFYSIESSFNQREDQRTSKFINASEALLSYNSEYHYLFSKVYQYREKEELSLEEAFLVANISRKLLESFLSFKYPKKRNDFRQLMEQAISDALILEKIYKFINKYSHNQIIEFGDEPLDNLLGESHNVVCDILNVIKDCDPKHFEEMQSVLEQSA